MLPAPPHQISIWLIVNPRLFPRQKCRSVSIIKTWQSFWLTLDFLLWWRAVAPNAILWMRHGHINQNALGETKRLSFDAAHTLQMHFGTGLSPPWLVAHISQANNAKCFFLQNTITPPTHTHTHTQFLICDHFLFECVCVCLSVCRFSAR